MTKPFTLQFTASECDRNILLRDFLIQQNISKTALTDFKSGGAILVNGKTETVRYIVQPGDRITVQYPPEKVNDQMKGNAMPLSIIYEDEYLLVTEKPAGISTIPSKRHPSETLANAIVHHYEQTRHMAAVHFATRLDLDTSGLVLTAKHRHIHHLISLVQQEQTITKTYLALAEGIPSPPEGRIDKPIGRIDNSRIRRQIHPDGQPAVTLYKTLNTFRSGTRFYSLIQLQLLTGRTHQIRVHMASLGHPLMGDSLYGGSCHLISRQALHCATLQFTHPVSGEPMHFESPLPDDMQQLINT